MTSKYRIYKIDYLINAQGFKKSGYKQKTHSSPKLIIHAHSWGKVCPAHAGPSGVQIID